MNRKHLNYCFLALLLVLLIALTGCNGNDLETDPPENGNDEAASETEEALDLTEYEDIIIKDELDITETEVTLKILISEDASEEDAQSLVEAKYEELTEQYPDHDVSVEGALEGSTGAKMLFD